jgi:hypothetical protein
VAIQFQVSIKAKCGPEEPVTCMDYNSLEVLEIENGKVSMIRKYNQGLLCNVLRPSQAPGKKRLPADVCTVSTGH